MGEEVTNEGATNERLQHAIRADLAALCNRYRSCQGELFCPLRVKGHAVMRDRIIYTFRVLR